MIYISGEKLQQLCEVYCGSDYDLNRNPKISSEKHKHINIELLSNDFDNPKLVFCYSNALSTFMKKLHLFKNPFVLVSHNEDTNITTEYTEIADNPLIIRWFTQNLMMNHPKVSFIPIGIANTMWPHGNLETLNEVRELGFKKDDRIYFYFNTWTNRPERELCRTIIERKGFQFGIERPHRDYLIDLAKCKFAICPPGNGIDCHRTWECYYLGVIPILLRSTFTENLSKVLPCIILDRWDNFDYNQIVKQYDMLSTLLVNNKYIDFTYYRKLFMLSTQSLPYSSVNWSHIKCFSHTDSKNTPLDFKLDKIIDKNDGFYIELGANDGLKQSNTAFFEFYRNWTGILVEPSPTAYNECVKNRPKSICYNYACVSNDFKETEIIGDFNGNLMSSIGGNRLKSNDLITVKTTTLENLLNLNKMKEIDLLSLDTEGYELNILMGLNLNKYRPKFIIIEIYNHDFDNIVSFLRNHNYTFVINFSNYNKLDNPFWDETHNDYLFVDTLILK